MDCMRLAPSNVNLTLVAFLMTLMFSPLLPIIAGSADESTVMVVTVAS